MHPADDAGRRAPFSGQDLAAALLKAEFTPDLDQILVDHSTVVLHFRTPLIALLTNRQPTTNAPTPLAAPADYAVFPEGDCWTFIQGRRIHVRATDGLVYLDLSSSAVTPTGPSRFRPRRTAPRPHRDGPGTGGRRRLGPRGRDRGPRPCGARCASGPRVPSPPR